MNKIKYLISFVLLCVLLTFTNAIYFQYTQSFESNFYRAVLNVGEQDDPENTMRDFTSAAADKNIDLFLVERDGNGFAPDKMTIYSTAGAEEYIEDNFELRKGRFKSVFYPELSLNYAELTDYDRFTYGITIYFIGQKSDIEEFYLEQSEKYSFDILCSPDKYSEFSRILICWGIFGFLIIIFSLFGIWEFEKEKTVRIINGKALSGLILKRSLTDNAIIIAVTAAAFLAISAVCYVGFYVGEFIAFLAVLIIINSCMHLAMLQFDLQRAFSDRGNSKVMLSFLLVTKIVVTVFVLTLMPMNINYVSQSVNFYRQEAFFEDNRNMNTISFYPQFELSDPQDILRLSPEMDELNKKFCMQYRESAVLDSIDDNTYISNWGEVDKGGVMLPVAEDEKDHPGIVMNMRCYRYYQEEIGIDASMLEKELRENDYILLFPKSVKLDDINVPSDGKYTFHEYGSAHITYCGTNLNYYSRLCSDPVIKLCSDEKAAEIPLEYFLYDVSAEEAKSFIEKNASDPANWGINVTPVLEVYRSCRDTIYSIGRLGAALCLVLLIIDGTVNFSIVKIYLSLHKKEFAVRQILGRPLFALIAKIVAISFGVILLCTGVAAIILKQLQMSGSVIPGALITAVTDAIVFAVSVKLFKRQKLVKILKGGAI